MQRHTKTLQEAKRIVQHLKFENCADKVQIGRCHICYEDVFIVMAKSADELINYGFCLNPQCGYVLTIDDPITEFFDRLVTRDDWL